MLIMKVTESDLPCDRIGLPPPDLAALQASAEKACALLKVLAHTDRLVLLCRLAQGEFCVSELEADLGIDTVMQAELFAAIRGKYDIPRREDLRGVRPRQRSRPCG